MKLRLGENDDMLTVINTTGKRKVDNKDVTFPRQKIVTGTYEMKQGETVERGGKPNEKGVLEAGFPTFAELSEFYQGAVEFQKKDGKIVESSPCLVKDAIAGWNQTESNSAFGRSPAQAEAQAESAFEKLAKSKGWTGAKKEEMRALLDME